MLTSKWPLSLIISAVISAVFTSVLFTEWGKPFRVGGKAALLMLEIFPTSPWKPISLYAKVPMGYEVEHPFGAESMRTDIYRAADSPPSIARGRCCQRGAPLTDIDKLQTKVLFLHGITDPTTPYCESEMLTAATPSKQQLPFSLFSVFHHDNPELSPLTFHTLFRICAPEMSGYILNSYPRYSLAGLGNLWG